jgi:hypothetical protein
VRIGGRWHAIVHARNGAILAKDIERKTIQEDAWARGQSAVETSLAFQPPRVRQAG